MTTLSSFQKTDNVDDHVAADYNRLVGSVLRSEFANTQTISATLELADSDCQFQVITPSGADRTVELAPSGTGNHVTVIYNADATYNILVKNDSGTTNFTTLAPDEWAIFVPVLGERWVMVSRTVTKSMAVLSSAFSITAAAGTYQDTGLSITLPSAGTYLLSCEVRTQLQGNAGTEWFLQGKLYNSTDGADVSNTTRMLVRVKTTNYIELTTNITATVTVTASKTIKLYACRNGAGTPSWLISQIASDGAGYTSLAYS